MIYNLKIEGKTQFSFETFQSKLTGQKHKMNHLHNSQLVSRGLIRCKCGVEER